MQFNPNLVPVLVLFALAAAQRANADLAGLSCADGIKPDSARCPHIAAALKQLLPVDTPPLKCIYERQFGTSNAETCITVAAALNALDDVEGFSCIYKYMLVSDSCPASIVALGQMVSTTVNATSTTLSTTTATGTSTTATVSLPHQIVCPVSETGEVQSSFVDLVWRLPKDKGMPELFSGDYSFVQSEYHKACAVGRSEHQGGGFIGKLNQDTEMIMCCNENMHDGLSIPIVMEGVGTFTEYGRFDDPAPRGIGSNYERTENAHVGAVRCDYPSAYPTWTPALKAKNLEECANECSSLDDCGGFNIVSGEITEYQDCPASHPYLGDGCDRCERCYTAADGYYCDDSKNGCATFYIPRPNFKKQTGGNCQLCTNDDIRTGESTVTAYLKKASGSYYGMCSKAILGQGDYKICCPEHWVSGIFIRPAGESTPFTTIQLNTTTTTTTTTSALEAASASDSSTNKTLDLVTNNSSKRGGTTAAIVIVVLLLVGVGIFLGRRQWLAHNAESSRREQAILELNGGGGIEMVDNPLRRVAVDNDAHAPIYDPPAGLPPARHSPAYYSSVAAAPGTQAEYAAPNELGGSAVYGGVEAGDVAAAYASPNEDASAMYAGAGSVGVAAAYAPITNASSMYAPSGDAGLGNGAALYTNDAYGNVPGSSTTNA